MSLLAEVDVLAALVGEEVADLLHERGGSLVGCGVARHLDGLGHEVADGFDILNEKVLGLAVVEGEGIGGGGGEVMRMRCETETRCLLCTCVLLNHSLSIQATIFSHTSHTPPAVAAGRAAGQRPSLAQSVVALSSLAAMSARMAGVSCSTVALHSACYRRHEGGSKRGKWFGRGGAAVRTWALVGSSVQKSFWRKSSTLGVRLGVSG